MSEGDEDVPKAGRSASGGGMALSGAERAALGDVVRWARLLDDADSYAGFTLVGWARERPEEAVAALEQALKREEQSDG